MAEPILRAEGLTKNFRVSRGPLRAPFGQAWFMANWAYEESKHTIALMEYLMRSGKRTEEQMWDLQHRVFQHQWQLPFTTSRQMTIYGEPETIELTLAEVDSNCGTRRTACVRPSAQATPVGVSRSNMGRAVRTPRSLAARTGGTMTTSPRLATPASWLPTARPASTDWPSAMASEPRYISPSP